MNYDVVVIGGGPAGCRTAGLIAQKGYKVMVAEEHPKIGEPMQCAGLVSPRTLKTAAVAEDIVINKIHGAFVHSPAGETLAIRGQQPYAYVIDRSEFDRRLSGEAGAAGVDIFTGVRASVEEFLPGGAAVKLAGRGGESRVFTRLLVGADGPRSQVARGMGVPPAEDVIRMYAAEVELRRQETDMAHIFLGREVAPGWFGWIIPVDRKRARVGIGVTGSHWHPRDCFKKMTDIFPGWFKGMRIICGTGGIVPIGTLTRIYGERTLLVGDAACQTKPLSGGGLYLGLLGAGLCAKVAVRALSSGNLSASFLSEYQSLWDREMADEIKIALEHRKIFLSMTDHEMDKLIKFFNHPLWRYIISKHGDIDYPSWLAGRLSFARPWADKFMINGLRKLLNCYSAVRA